MQALSRHGRRVAVSLLPLLLGVLHVLGLLPMDGLQRLDDQLYDARLRWTMPATLDERVVIVSDFLWGIYYVLGWHNVENALLREQVAAARTLLAGRAAASVRFIHVKGHERDGSALGRWNDVADRLCGLGREVDLMLPEVNKQITDFGMAPVGSTSEQFAATYQAERPIWKQLYIKAGLQVRE